MNPLVEKLEKRLLPEFEKVAERIRHEISNITVRVYSSSVGSETQYQGYSFHLECCLTEALSWYDEADNVGLDVGLGYLTTIPRICANVGWGYPSDYSEAAFRDWSGLFPNEGIIVTEEVLEELYKDLPRLYEALFTALKRRKPLNE